MSTKVTSVERQESFGKLKDIADSKGLSMYRIAKDLGYSTVLFTDWKNGKSMPNTMKMLKIADYLEVQIKDILPTEK